MYETGMSVPLNRLDDYKFSKSTAGFPYFDTPTGFVYEPGVSSSTLHSASCGMKLIEK